MDQRMLTQEDYRCLKQSVRGWTTKRLASYGVPWPPAKGWRKRLIREYETQHMPAWHSAIDPAELARLEMKRLYQEKSGDYSY